MQAQFHHHKDGGKSKFQKGKENWKVKQENKGDSYKKQNSDTSHGDSSNQKKGKGEKKPFDKRKIQCYKCSKFGHFANECRSGKGGKHKSDDEAYVAKDDGLDSEEALLMMTTKIDLDQPGIWYLDTGCSNHMTGHKNWLLDLDESVKSKVRFADNTTIDAEGIGKVMIKRGEGKPAYLTDVLYVPSMKTNLLSLGQLLQKGFSMNMR